uniref:ECF transporter S component n=1 Tax=Candidatus Methanomethylicus mesodigestus TaxID=1867258 RepID=A0A7C3FCN2_9CREN
MKSNLPRTKRIAYLSILVALAITLRLLKTALFGPVQFINFPGVFTVLGGILFGPMAGFVIGFGSFLFSDIIIGLPGLWTATTSLSMGVIGIISGLIWMRRDKEKISKAALGVSTYILILFYDIFTSVILLVVMMRLDWISALTIGILGLFLPVPASGGFMIGVGPITEFTTTMFVVLIFMVLIKNHNIIWPKK